MLTACFDSVLGALLLVSNSTIFIPLEHVAALSDDIGGAVWRSLVDQAGGGVWSVMD